MSKKIILPLALLTSTAWAEINPQFLKLLESKLAPQLSCETSGPRNFKACIESLCGQASETETADDLYGSLVINGDAPLSPELKALKEKIDLNLQHEFTDLNQDILAFSNPVTLANTVLEPELVPVHKILASVNTLQELDLGDMADEADISGTRLVISLNETKLKQKLGTKAAHAPIILELLNNSDLQTAMYASQIGWIITNQQRYPELTTKQIIQKELEERKQIMLRIQNEAPRAFALMTHSSIVNQNILDQVLKEEDPSEKLQTEFFDSMMNLRLISKYLLSGAPQFDKMKVSKVGDLYPAMDLSTQMIKNKRLVANFKAKPEILEAKKKYCEAIYQKGLLALPSPAEQAAFKKTASAVRDSLKQKISGSLSKETSEVISGPLDKIFFDLPSSPKEMGFLMTEQVSSLNEEQALKTHKLSGADKSLNPNDLRLLNLHDFMNQSEEQFGSRLKRVCDEFEVPNLNDASYSYGSGKIQVSWMSIKRPEMGKAIVAHELGHAMSTILRKTPISEHSAHHFESVRECLSSKQPQVGLKNEIVHYKAPTGEAENLSYDVSKFVEENWADYVEAKYAPEGVPNSSCFLLSKNNGEYADESLSNAESEDTHSPNLFRLLHIEFERNKKFPPACEEALNADEKFSLKREC